MMHAVRAARQHHAREEARVQKLNERQTDDATGVTWCPSV